MSILDLEAILGESMESVEAAPDYVQLDTGVYTLVISDTGIKKQKRDLTKPENAGKDAEYVQLSHTYAVEAVHECEGKLPPAIGSLTTDTWMYGETGLPYFKARTLAICEANGEDPEQIGKLSLGEQLEGVKGLRFKVSVTKQERTDAPGRFNTRFSNICAAD